MNYGRNYKVAVTVTLALFLTGLYVVADSKDWVAPDSAKKQQNPIKATPDSIQKGKAIYEKKCLSCHGESGKGDGPVAKMQSEMPQDLTDAKLMSEMTDGEIFWKISTGKDPMPKFDKILSKDDRWNVINYVRTFSGTGKDKK
jgi:mono/diheme cytochrome c family protein